jgi:membrane protein
VAVDLAGLRARAHRYFERDLWRRPKTADEPTARRLGRAALQVGVIVVQGIERDKLMLRASALTYFAMLSVIPMLAVVSGLVGAFGASEDVARVVVDRIAVGYPDAAETILDMVRKVNFRSLGAYGGVSLFVFTVIALGSVESAFNAIWGIERVRSPVRRFTDYLAVLVIAPLLFTVAVSVATGLRSETLVARLLVHPGLAHAYELGLRQAPVLLIWLGFAFLYWFLPNTVVRIPPALIAGAMAAISFTIMQLLYIRLNVGVARANAVFGSFAALPLLLGWIYLSWVVVLLGCEIAFAVQNLATFRVARQGEEPRPAAREAFGVAIALRVARCFRSGEPVTAARVAGELDVPVRTVRAILTELETAGIVACRGVDASDQYQLGRAAERIEVAEVLEALRGRSGLPGAPHGPDGPVRALVGDVEKGVAGALRSRTLADLLVEEGAVDPPKASP